MRMSRLPLWHVFIMLIVLLQWAFEFEVLHPDKVDAKPYSGRSGYLIYDIGQHKEKEHGNEKRLDNISGMFPLSGMYQMLIAIICAILILKIGSDARSGFSFKKGYPYLTSIWETLFGIQTIPTSIIALPFSINQYVDEIVKENKSVDELMHYEWSRYLSFNTFPQDSIMMPMRLSQAGFYYTGHGEEVKCFCCGVINEDWTTKDSALEVHTRLSPRCSFMNRESNDNIPIHSNEYYSDILRSQCDQRERGNEHVVTGRSIDIENTFSDKSLRRKILKGQTGTVDKLQLSKSGQLSSTEQVTFRYPYFENIADRIDSFMNWPVQSVQSPNDLAQAGFFYIGKEDIVICFCCGKGFKEWERSDIPFVEHIRLSPKCQYMKQRQHEPLPKPSLPNNDSIDNAALTQTVSELRRKLKYLSDEKETLSDENKKQSDEIEILRDQNMCKVCLVNECKVVFLPCGHMACQECAVYLTECPICRSIIKGTCRTYQS